MKLILKGMAASPGIAEGVVQIVEGIKDLHRFKEGSILVTEVTEPTMVIMMNKAAAIVTNKGGVTSHAAIVARELGIPCIIGTKIATKVLKDNDIVEVKANHGLVIIQRRADESI